MVIFLTPLLSRRIEVEILALPNVASNVSTARFFPCRDVACYISDAAQSCPGGRGVLRYVIIVTPAARRRLSFQIPFAAPTPARRALRPSARRSRPAEPEHGLRWNTSLP